MISLIREANPEFFSFAYTDEKHIVKDDTLIVQTPLGIYPTYTIDPNTYRLTFCGYNYKE